MNEILLKDEDVRNKIMSLQESMMTMDNQITCPLKHIFSPGIYAREIFIPKDALVVGKIHKHAHVNIISKGIAEVVTEFGSVRLEAPCTFVSEPGTKRAVLAIEDLIWTTIHHNPEDITDTDLLEDGIIAKSYDELLLLNSSNIPLIEKEGTMP
jgi:hypothetical protein